MQYRIDSKTGNELSILGFGCMRFPRARGKIDMVRTEAMILYAISQGINYFDTAYIYPGSEEAVGKIIDRNGLRDKIFMATKLPLFMCKSYADFDKLFNKSLERLKTDYIDYYLMHMITTPEQWRHLCDLGIENWIDEKKAEGKIRQLGFSFHGKREDFVSIVDARDWDFCMIQYNYLDIYNQATRTGLGYAASKGMPVFIMEPLLGGRLANPGEMPQRVGALMKEANPALTPAAWGLRWVWNHSNVTLLLSGMSTMEQLDENLATADTMSAPGILTAAELETVENVISVFNESRRIPCTGCGYCTPCPVGVNIPGSFLSYNSSYIIKRHKALRRYVMETAALTSTKGLASACVDCGKCEKQCPQNIPVRHSLKRVKKRLEPFWFRVGIAMVRWFTGFRAKKKG